MTNTVLDYDILTLAREARLYVLARIKAGQRPADEHRRPLNLSVVLDRSGSMAGDKLDYVKRATAFLVQRLGGEDRFSLVTYNEAVTVDVSPGPVAHKDRLNQAIQSLRANGTTNLSGGWLQGCTLVAEGMATGQVNRVLLLTDGLANEGITAPSRLAALARQKRAEGVTTTTIGVGLGFNEDLLTTLANEGGGAFYFIDNPDRAPLIFNEELQDLLSVIGQNLTITLTTTSDDVASVAQLNAYPSERSGGSTTYRLGDLYADETKLLLLELRIPQLETLGETTIGELRFAYDALHEESVEHRELTLPIVVNAAAPVSEDELAAQTSEVMRSVLLLGAARAREEAIERADAGDFDEASQVLSQAADAIEEAGLDDEALAAEHNMLREEAIDMELGPQRYDAYSRKATSTKSFITSSAPRHADETIALHGRLKSARRALERKGPTPARITWQRESLDLQGVDRVSIGRAEANDIVIAQEEVSAQHCQIVRDGDRLYLEDLNSTNGTYANGGRVGNRFRLSVGDIVTVGTWLFILRDADRS